MGWIEQRTKCRGSEYMGRVLRLPVTQCADDTMAEGLMEKGDDIELGEERESARRRVDGYQVYHSMSVGARKTCCKRGASPRVVSHLVVL